MQAIFLSLAEKHWTQIDPQGIGHKSKFEAAGIKSWLHAQSLLYNFLPSLCWPEPNSGSRNTGVSWGVVIGLVRLSQNVCCHQTHSLCKSFRRKFKSYTGPDNIMLTTNVAPQNDNCTFKTWTQELSVFTLILLLYCHKYFKMAPSS